MSDLVKEMYLLPHENPDVLKLREEIPNESIRDCEKCQSLVDEINRRERKYTQVPLSKIRVY